MKYWILTVFIGFTLSTNAQEKDAVAYNNEGNEFVRNKDFKSAYQSYLKALKLFEAEGKTDTNLIYNAGYCAYKSKKYDEAIPYLQKSAEFGYKGAMPYVYLAQIGSKKKDYEGMEANLLKGLETHPKNKNLNKLMGVCYLKQGLVFFNEGNKIKKKANDSGLNESDPEKFKAEYAKADKKFKQALPLFEKSYKYAPKNKSTIKALNNIYTNLDMPEKAAEMKSKLK